jgi:hypothetical protein
MPQRDIQRSRIGDSEPRATGRRGAGAAADEEDQMSEQRTADEPDDGGQRPAVQPRRGHEIPEREIAAPDEAVGDFGDSENADRGGDSDVER